MHTDADRWTSGCWGCSHPSRIKQSAGESANDLQLLTAIHRWLVHQVTDAQTHRQATLFETATHFPSGRNSLLLAAIMPCNCSLLSKLAGSMIASKAGLFGPSKSSGKSKMSSMALARSGAFASSSSLSVCASVCEVVVEEDKEELSLEVMLVVRLRAEV